MAERLRVAVSGKVLRRNVGGNSTYAGTLYEHLARLGVEAEVLVTPADECRGVVRQLSYAAIEGLVWPRAADRADLLHFPADTGALVSGSVPVVATVHGVPPQRGSGPRWVLRERVWRARVGRLASVADAVITVSRSSAVEIRRAFGVPADKLHVIPHGVDTGRFHPEADGDAAALEPLGLPAPFVLYLGNLDPRKNIPALVEAMARPAVARLGARLVVAGGSFVGSEPIERLLESAPHVHYLGQVESRLVAPLMRAAAAFVFPSTHEGFGIPVVEAMACGTPVVTSDRGALPEVAGDAAIMLAELSPAALAGAVAEVLSTGSVAAELRIRGLANAQRFTWAESARRHLEVFGSLVPSYTPVVAPAVSARSRG